MAISILRVEELLRRGGAVKAELQDLSPARFSPGFRIRRDLKTGIVEIYCVGADRTVEYQSILDEADFSVRRVTRNGQGVLVLFEPELGRSALVEQHRQPD